MIAGEARGRRLKSLESKKVRPMTDQIREALFSTLAGRVAGANFLDLYAGTGSVGIEALSRGAAHSTFVEQDPEVVSIIRQNLETTKLTDRATVLLSEVELYVEVSPSEPFDLVMLDPPFDKGIPTEVVEALSEGQFLADGALVVLRVASRLAGPERGLVFGERWTRRYGDSTLIYMSEEEAIP